ncbi:MAG TPA: transferase [Ramlibacter sp.]|nr:transferase [Ramlibacter sp.]
MPLSDHGGFDRLNFDTPFIVEDGRSRSLHFTHGEIQSSMRLDRPDALHVDYTRTMMGVLLLDPQPRDITMVGLGGGSLVKFCHRYLPSVGLTVLENNPAVIAMRQRFGIPDDDARLRVVLADGAAYVANAPRPMTVLMVDGFDSTGQPPRLCSQAFYDHCFHALRPGGMLVVNLHADHPDHGLHTSRIAHSFKGNAMQVLAPDKSNCIVFAARRRPVTLQALRSREWASRLDAAVQAQLRGEFAHIGWNACRVAALPA